jgi:LacI family transcriptional regulator
MFELPHSTISDIAVLAHTSKENVARVMLGKSGVPVETQKRIMQTIKLLSRPDDNKSLANVFGVILTDHLNADDYMGRVTQGIALGAEKHGLHMMLHIYSRDYEANYFELLRRNHLANGFITTMPYDYHLLIEFCREHHIPMVLIDHHTGHEFPNNPVVEVDNYGGARAAIEHLLALGHRRIAHITGPLHIRSAAERARGYQEALVDAEIPFERAIMPEGNFKVELVWVHGRALLGLPRPPTAIFAVNDQTALGVMAVARERGLIVGRDLSVVGFDDLLPGEQADPPLTTVRQPMQEMGECAADLIARLLGGEKEVRMHHVFPAELVIRSSTGRKA